MSFFPVTIRLGEHSERYSASPSRPALFLDRDGIINIDTGYVGDAGKLTLLKPTYEAVREANRAGIPVIVVSNQSGVGRGYFGWDAVAQVDEAIAKAFADADAMFDLILYAGRAPDSGKDDPFRKPSPGLFILAAQIIPISLGESFMVGDKVGDLEAAARAGLTAGALFSDGKDSLEKLRAAFPNFVAVETNDLNIALSSAMKFLTDVRTVQASD